MEAVNLVADMKNMNAANQPVTIISLSDDGEEELEAAAVTKKRKSVESGVSSGEERFRLKRRKIKVAGAPKMPLTGYVRYMNSRRESLRKEHPSKTAIEHTKMIGEEWQTLTDDIKAPYMKEAEVDKQRYLAELHTFLKARPDVLACELAKNKQRKNSVDGKCVLKEKTMSNINGNGNGGVCGGGSIDIMMAHMLMPEKSERTSPPPLSNALDPLAMKRKRTPTPTSNIITAPIPGEIPIFTNEFLEHNKIFDMELRTLRKSKADLEQQNAVLEKHVENMKFGVEKMTNENDELQEKNRLLELYLDKLKRKLAHALAGLAIPTEPNGATVDNIDKYLQDLYKMTTTHTHGIGLNKAKDIIRKLDLQIQL